MHARHVHMRHACLPDVYATNLARKARRVLLQDLKHIALHKLKHKVKLRREPASCSSKQPRSNILTHTLPRRRKASRRLTMFSCRSCRSILSSRSVVRFTSSESTHDERRSTSNTVRFFELLDRHEPAAFLHGSPF